jgi:hypothetical protein
MAATKIGAFLPLASRKRVVKEPLPDVLAVAGTSVLEFRKPNTIGDHSFQDIRMDCSKGRESRRSGGCGQGSFGSPKASILSKTAGARVEILCRNASFLNGLIHGLHRRVKTGFRFTSQPATGGGYGSNLDTPRHQVREGRLFKCRSARRVRRLKCLEVRFKAGRWV